MLTKLPTSTASSSSSAPRRTVGLAFAKSPRKKDGKSKDVFFWSISSKPSPKTSRRIDPIPQLFNTNPYKTAFLFIHAITELIGLIYH